ncbi:MAG: class D sortase [Ruminococcus sp.]|nr:class D sortase [Ruminococcus sp.]
MSTKKKNTIIPHIAAPFFIAAICAAVVSVALIKPYDKLKMYADIAFMDKLKTDPSDDSGLVIRDNDIAAHTGDTSETGEVVRPKFGEMYALIKCDAFDVDVPVYWGSQSELLEKGACQSSGSVVIGTEGNAVISAHVDTFFANLSKLKKDDVITVSTNYGEFTYKVTELITFNAADRKYVVPSTETKLTLYTCKRDILGNTDQRVGVICAPVKSAFYTDVKEAE